MKMVALGIVLAAGAASQALSTDVGKVRNPQAVDWTGPFVGTHFANAVGSSQYSLAGPGAVRSSGSLDLGHPFDAFKGIGSDAIGLRAGFDYMLPSRA